MHYTEILGRAQDDERAKIVHFFLKLALMGLDPQSLFLILLLQKEIPRQARNDEAGGY